MTQQSGAVTLNGATVIANTFTQTGTTNQVTFAGNVDANNGVDVTGAVSVAGTLVQTGSSNQVSFAGNVDATNGLDVTGANLTVGGTNFTVAPGTGNTSIAGTLGVTGAATLSNSLAVAGNTTLSGNTTMGNGNGDVVAMDVSGVGGALTVAGLPTTVGTDVMMVGAGNVVSRSPITTLIDADNGLTYNEAGSARVRLGATTNLLSPLTGNRFVNLGVSDLTFTTSNGTANLVVMNGDATNYGVAVNANGTGAIDLTGRTNITGQTAVVGATTITGAITQNGLSNQVTFNGNVDATNGLDVTGQNLTVGGTAFTVGVATGNTVVGGTLAVSGNATMNGSVTMGNGTNDNVTIDVSGGAGALKVSGLPNANGTSLLVIDNNDIVSKTAINNLIAADNGITYDEGGSGMIRLGSTTTTASTMTASRNVNMGNFDLAFTTNGGLNNVLLLDGAAANYGATINAGGTGAINLNGTTNVTGPTTIVGNTAITGTVTQNGGGQVTFSGNVDANNGLDVQGASNLNGNTTVTGNLAQSSGTVTIGGATTIAGATAVNSTLAVTGNTTLSSNLTVNGNTTLGDASADNVTVNAATVSMPNLGTTATSNNFVMSTAGGVLATRTINNIVTGTGTQDRMTRWGVGGNNIVDASLSDNGTGLLSRSGNIQLNPGAGNTLSTNGNFSVTGSATVTGTTNLNGAVNVGNGGDAVVVDVSSSTLKLNGLNTAAGVDLLMVDNANTVTRTPLTSLIGADQGLTYNEDGTGKVYLGSTTPGQNSITGLRYVNIGNSDRLSFTTNSGLSDVFVIRGSATNYSADLRSAGTGSIGLTGNVRAQAPTSILLQSGVVSGNTLTSGTELELTDVGASLTYKNSSFDASVAFDGSTGSVVISSDDGTDNSELEVGPVGTTVKGTFNQVGFGLVQISGNTEFAGSVDVAGNFAVNVDRFTVDGPTGNTFVKGTFEVDGAAQLDGTLAVAQNTSLGAALTVAGATTLNGSANIGNGNGDAVTIDVTGSSLTINGVTSAIGTDVMMLDNSNVVSRTPISSLIGADQGLTYNEGGNGKVRLGSLTNATNALTTNRFVNLGVSDLIFTTNNGAANLVVMNGDATNYGVALNAAGTGAVAITGTTAIIGATTVGGTFTQSTGAVTLGGATTINNTIAQTGGGQVSFSGNVDAANGLDVVGLTTLTGAVTQIGTGQVTFGGNVDANNGLDVVGATTVTGNTTLTGNLTQTTGTVAIGGATTMSNSSIRMTSLPGGAAADEIVSIDVASGSLRRSTAATLLNDDVWLLDGNTTGGTKTMGSNDNFDIGFETNGTTRLTITKDGRITQNGANQVTLAGNLDANGGVDVTGGNLTVGVTNFTVDVTNGNTAIAGTLGVTGAASLSSTLTVSGTSTLNGATTVNNTFTQTGSANQVTFAGNVDANNGLDVAGANFTVGTNKFTVDVTNGNTSIAGTLGVTGATTLSSTLAVTGNTTIGGTLGVTGATTLSNTLTQNGGGQVTFSGNVDANNGLDVTGATNLTGATTVVGTTNINTAGGGVATNIGSGGNTVTIKGTVNINTTAGETTTIGILGGTNNINGTTTLTGPTSLVGTVTQSGGQVTFGGNVDANSGLDITGSLTQTTGNVSLNVTGNNMTVAGLGSGTFTDDVLLISTGTNVVKRRSMADLIGAEYGLTYNEANNGKVRIGAASNVGSELGADRYINLATNDLYFTTDNGSATVLKVDGGAANAYGLTVNAGSAGSISLNGATSITGSTSVSGSVTQSGGAVAIGGATTISNASVKMTAIPSGAAADEIVSIDVASGSIRRSTASSLLNDDVWLLDGNTTGATKTLGSNDNQDIAFETNGITRLAIDKTGQIIQNGAHQITLSGNVQANGGLDVVGTTNITGSLVQTGGTVDLKNGELSILLDAGTTTIGYEDVSVQNMAFYSSGSTEMSAATKTGTARTGSVRAEIDGDVILTSTYGSPVSASASTVLSSGATGSSITTTAGTITQNASTMNLNTTAGNITTIGNSTGTTTVNGAATMNGDVTLNGDVKGAGSNKFADRVTLNGTVGGLYSFTINNTLIKPTSVIVMTLESYSGSGILMHQIQSRIAGSVTVMLSQPLLSGETVIVNYMVVNQ
jgi:hypothetical protein